MCLLFSFYFMEVGSTPPMEPPPPPVMGLQSSVSCT